ncbi:MULE transposase domain-containing protein [Ditylenchus destructor]|uniref:MULE transposase domain-containing protein n=1 Tax=Ditylenchus destructor TaxID=166010 RepID=A0AAD4R349_9BILA|nr:MULE transposase domain-containing protein [Ditylenchus destructor]
MVFVVSEWAKTNKGKDEAVYHSVNFPGHSYRFQLDDSKRCRYVCATCRTCDDKAKVRIVIRDSVFSRNPDELEHVCRAKISSTKVIVTNRKVLNNAKAKPQILNVRVIKAADPKAPDIKAYNKPWPRDIITLREGANEDNFFIVFEESRETHAPMIIFSDMVGLWTLWKADHISCDGNFKYVPHLPHKFLEVYTLHAIHHDLPDRSQATLSAFALMTAKDQASYTKMFEELSRKMHSLFGACENQKTWHFDHEMAAITACQIAFPIDRVVSCYFHFVKNCYSNAVDIGLKKRLAKNAELRKWLRTLIGGVHLTKDHHAIMWDHLLQNPPLIPEQANLLRFVNYFRRQWHTDAARALINQHENRGPRTTNFSEGWNNTLRNKFGSKHPGLGEFIQAMKRELYSQSVANRSQSPASSYFGANLSDFESPNIVKRNKD